MRYSSVCLAGVLAMAPFGLAASANAETLSVVVHEPAATEALIGQHRIVVGPFEGGRWGDLLRSYVSGVLNGAAADGEKMYETVHYAESDEGDLVMTGGFFYEDDMFEVEPEVERKCKTRDEDGECTEYSEKVTPCRRAEVNTVAHVEFTRPETGIVLYHFASEETDGITSCSEAYWPSVGGYGEQMLFRAIEAVKAEILPRQETEAFRIQESRKGLSKPDRVAFKQAVRLTKSDPEAACDAFEALAPANPDSVSVQFNIGLCDEMRGLPDEAYQHYLDVLDIEPKQKYTRAAMQRLDLRSEAERQIAKHFAAISEVGQE